MIIFLPTPSSLSPKPILFVRKYGVFLDPLSPSVLGRHIWNLPSRVFHSFIPTLDKERGKQKFDTTIGAARFLSSLDEMFHNNK